MQRLVEEMALQIVGYLLLQGPAGGDPLVEKAAQLLDVDEQVLGRADLRLGAGERAHRVDQVGRAVVAAALVATVAVLVRRVALGTGALDEAVGQEGAGRRVVKLRDFLFAHQGAAAEGRPDLAAILAVLLAVRAAVVVELDLEAVKVPQVGRLHAAD